jgi:hypothetical protein
LTLQCYRKTQMKKLKLPLVLAQPLARWLLLSKCH